MASPLSCCLVAAAANHRPPRVRRHRVRSRRSGPRPRRAVQGLRVHRRRRHQALRRRRAPQRLRPRQYRPRRRYSSPPPLRWTDLASTKAAVAAAVVQSRQDYLYAIENYDAPDALEVLSHTWAPDSPSWNLTLTNMEQLRSNGWRARPNPDVPDQTIVEGEVNVIDGPPATSAQVTACTISSGVVFKPGAAPDGGDLIVNDEIVARRTLVTAVLQNGGWKVSEGQELGSWNGSTSCPVALAPVTIIVVSDAYSCNRQSCRGPM